MVVLTVSLFRPANAWAQVAKALQAQAWVHSRTLGPDGKEYGEGWFSPKFRVIAGHEVRRLETHDTTLRTFTKYIPAEETVYVVLEQKDRLSMNMDFYHGAARSQGAEQIASVWHGSGSPDAAEG